MTADLHIHTYASDGALSPKEVAALAKSAGLGCLSVTDHDTTANTEEVRAECEKFGIKAVNGIEVSAYDWDVKIHTLGYGFDNNCDIFRGFLEKLRENSFERAADIVKKLNAVGVRITFEEVKAMRAIGSTPIHGMHIASCGAAKGYAPTPHEFYKRYMCPGMPAFSNILRPTPREAVEVINASGGFAVLAHPGRVELSAKRLKVYIKRLTAAGLTGIEAVYSSHTNRETAYYKELAEEFNLIVTGGSDTHYTGGSKKIGKPLFEVGEALGRRLGI